MLKLLFLALAAMVATTPDAYADAFSTVVSKGKSLFTNVRTVVFVMGGFGLVGLAVGAIFGAVKWKWFASLAFGLVILAIANAVVEYFTSSVAGSESSATGMGVDDTM